MNDPTTLALIGTALIALAWVAIERWQRLHHPRYLPRDPHQETR